MPVIELKDRLPTIRVETRAGRVSGIVIDGHRLRGLAEVTISAKSGPSPQMVCIQLVGDLELAEPEMIQPSPTPKNGTV
ncbi:hypothetical protein [Microvirgula aerodenitrificans]|uniref:hypothetical protein n=1 Tax=Microvirgula aerodenitrificans TaxID=57480 RepID=UPI00248EE453|nr:hypothetical protein [Microvirgula aerodenitrificans]